MNPDFSQISQHFQDLFDADIEDPSFEAWFSKPINTTSKVSELCSSDKSNMSEADVTEVQAVPRIRF